MVNPELSILPPKYYSENPPEKVAFAPVGAGGYKFVSYKAGRGHRAEGVRQVSARQAAGR